MIASAESCASCRYFRADAPLSDAANDAPGTCRRKLPELLVNHVAQGNIRVATGGQRSQPTQIQVQTYWPPVTSGDYCGQYAPARSPWRELRLRAYDAMMRWAIARS